MLRFKIRSVAMRVLPINRPVLYRNGLTALIIWGGWPSIPERPGESLLDCVVLQIGEFDRTITVSATVDPKVMTFHIPGNSGDPRLTSEFELTSYVKQSRIR